MINPTGLCLVLITVFLSGLIVFVNPYISKITKKYFFWMPIGILLLIYFITFRFWNDFKNFLEFKDGIYASKGLLLDMCPFNVLLLSILMICDPKRKILPIVAPFALFGGIITLFGGIMLNSDEITTQACWNLHWIFIGNEPNSMYFIIHFILFFFPSWILVLDKNIKPKYQIGFGLVFWFTYMIYVIICVHIFHVDSNATGLVPGDWDPYYGEYGGFSIISKLVYPYSMVVGFFFIVIIILIIIFLFYFIKTRKHWNK